MPRPGPAPMPALAALAADLLALALVMLLLVGRVPPTGATATPQALALAAAIAVGVAGALVFDMPLRRMKAAATAHVGGRIMTRVGAALFAKLARWPLERLTGAYTTAQQARVRQFAGAPAALTGPVAGFPVEAPFLIALTLALRVIAGPLSLLPVAALARNAVILPALPPGSRER